MTEEKEPVYKVRYSNENVEIVPKSKLDSILKSGKKVFEVTIVDKES